MTGATGDPAEMQDAILARIASATSPDALEAVRIEYLGRKGAISTAMRDLGALEGEARRERGAALNALKESVIAAINSRKSELRIAAMAAQLAGERVDITLPPRPEAVGRIHPLSRTLEEVVAIFGEMGLRVAEGPDIETDYNNFTALNIPPDHPARQEHDTFYLPPDDKGERKVLRTHTSPVQIRTMLKHNKNLPIRIIAPGRTYRSDHDATHSPMFHQCEGLVVGEGIHMGHLKYCLIEFCRAFFGIDDLPLRFRPSYFPFTEPSAEVDIGCARSKDGLQIGAGDDWLEILGCGMVNPRVLENCGIDTGKYTGFAFGMGLERITMLKYGIPDLRAFYESDLRWMRHYGFMPYAPPSLHLGLGE